MRGETVIFPKLLVLYFTYWFFEVPKIFFSNLLKFASALEHFLSLTLMVKTFFRPWKNETRPGYYFYAVGISAVVKFLLILVDLVILFGVFVFGAIFILIFTFLPIVSLILILTGF